MTAVEERVTGPGPVTVETMRPAPTQRTHLSARATPSVAARALALALTALSLWFFLFAVVLTGSHEHSAQVRLYDRLRAELAAATAPLGPPIRPGAPVALLDAPAAHIHNLVVVEGTTGEQTADGPGHLTTTPLPGQAGAAVLLGRSLTYGAPFADLRHFRPGDVIKVVTQQGAYHYRVLDVRGPHSPLPAPLAPGGARLVLVSSAASGWRSGWAPAYAVYVDADLSSGQVQPAPAGTRLLQGAAALPMRADGAALVPLVLWLELVVVVAAGATWCWLRWSRVQTWLIGVPLLLGALWGATTAATMLLPNLM